MTHQAFQGKQSSNFLTEIRRAKDIREKLMRSEVTLAVKLEVNQVCRTQPMSVWYDVTRSGIWISFYLSNQRLQKARVPKFLLIVFNKVLDFCSLRGTWPTSKFFM